MKDYLGAEKVVHGQAWGALHDGYFSDPAVARPLVETASAILAASPADVIVDLGGGTGFLLSQLAASGACTGADLVNLDCSETQLALAGKESVSRICASIDGFRRGDLVAMESRVFFMMRSVFHYVGEGGLSPLLRHLRAQAKAGEFFVHQTASFAHQKEADFINDLYRRMHTDKWYPTVGALQKLLADAGWRVTATIPAPTLRLTSEDLARRYALDTRDLANIRDMMAKTPDPIDKVARLTTSGFEAYLHYWVYTCVADGHSV